MSPVRSVRTSLLVLVVALGLVACSGTSNLIKPAELVPNPALLGVRLAWSAKVGVTDFPLDVRVNGNLVALASWPSWTVELAQKSGASILRNPLALAWAATAGWLRC